MVEWPRPSSLTLFTQVRGRRILPRVSVYESLRLGRSDTLPDQVGGLLHAPEQNRTRA